MRHFANTLIAALFLAGAVLSEPPSGVQAVQLAARGDRVVRIQDRVVTGHDEAIPCISRGENVSKVSGIPGLKSTAPKTLVHCSARPPKGDSPQWPSLRKEKREVGDKNDSRLGPRASLSREGKPEVRITPHGEHVYYASNRDVLPGRPPLSHTAERVARLHLQQTGNFHLRFGLPAIDEMAKSPGWHGPHVLQSGWTPTPRSPPPRSPPPKSPPPRDADWPPYHPSEMVLDERWWNWGRPPRGRHWPYYPLRPPLDESGWNWGRQPEERQWPYYPRQPTGLAKRAVGDKKKGSQLIVVHANRVSDPVSDPQGHPIQRRAVPFDGNKEPVRLVARAGYRINRETENVPAANGSDHGNGQPHPAPAEGMGHVPNGPVLPHPPVHVHNPIPHRVDRQHVPLPALTPGEAHVPNGQVPNHVPNGVHNHADGQQHLVRPPPLDLGNRVPGTPGPQISRVPPALEFGSLPSSTSERDVAQRLPGHSREFPGQGTQQRVVHAQASNIPTLSGERTPPGLVWVPNFGYMRRTSGSPQSGSGSAGESRSTALPEHAALSPGEGHAPNQQLPNHVPNGVLSHMEGQQHWTRPPQLDVGNMTPGLQFGRMPPDVQFGSLPSSELDMARHQPDHAATIQPPALTPEERHVPNHQVPNHVEGQQHLMRLPSLNSGNRLVQFGSRPPSQLDIGEPDDPLVFTREGIQREHRQSSRTAPLAGEVTVPRLERNPTFAHWAQIIHQTPQRHDASRRLGSTPPSESGSGSGSQRGSDSGSETGGETGSDSESGSGSGSGRSAGHRSRPFGG